MLAIIGAVLPLSTAYAHAAVLLALFSFYKEHEKKTGRILVDVPDFGGV